MSVQAPEPRITNGKEQSEFGDFLLVVRRSMLSICAYIEARYGNQEPRIVRPPQDKPNRRAA